MCFDKYGRHPANQSNKSWGKSQSFNPFPGMGRNINSKTNKNKHNQNKPKISFIRRYQVFHSGIEATAAVAAAAAASALRLMDADLIR